MTLNSSPDRRAGHSLVGDQNNVYLFGGRGKASNNMEFGLNDIWRYNEMLRVPIEFKLYYIILYYIITNT